MTSGRHIIAEEPQRPVLPQPIDHMEHDHTADTEEADVAFARIVEFIASHPAEVDEWRRRNIERLVTPFGIVEYVRSRWLACVE